MTSPTQHSEEHSPRRPRTWADKFADAFRGLKFGIRGQSSFAVHFFLAAYGPKRFIDFCSNLRDGYSVERALSFATASRTASLGALEDAWRTFLLSDF